MDEHKEEMAGRSFLTIETKTIQSVSELMDFRGQYLAILREGKFKLHSKSSEKRFNGGRITTEVFRNLEGVQIRLRSDRDKRNNLVKFQVHHYLTELTTNYVLNPIADLA